MDLKLINQWAVNNLAIIVACLFVFILILLGRLISIGKKLKKYQYLFKGNEGKDLEAVLLTVSEKVHLFNERLNELDKQFLNHRTEDQKHMQKWNLVRFKAFQNTGGDQSFALAVLDGNGDGYVMSSIFGREESRVYCKPVQTGVSSYALSDEEKEAIEKAMGARS